LATGKTQQEIATAVARLGCYGRELMDPGSDAADQINRSQG
jgi:hypothetical protein